MNPERTWTWRLVVLASLTVATAAAALAISVRPGSLKLWSGSTSGSKGAEADGATQTLLSEAEAEQVRDRVKAMMNPAESAEAAAQLREQMESLVQQQSPAAPLTMVLFLESLAPQFGSLDTEMRQISLSLLADILVWYGQNSTTCWMALLVPSKAVLISALADPSSEVTVAALQIVRSCWEWSPPDVDAPGQKKALGTWKAELHERCVELLHCRNERIRWEAGVTVVSVPIDDAAVKGLSLLDDASPRVRRMLLLALSDRPEVLPSDDLLCFLNDADAGVRSTADVVLTSRGLSREQISLAARATSPSPEVRAQAPRYIADSSVVDQLVWLTHLSHDEAALVRAEAARALAAVGGPDCHARLAEMATSDSDAAVRQLAVELARQVAGPSAGTAPEQPRSDPVTLPVISSPRAN